MRQAVYKNYLLSVLVVILALNYLDRLALGLLMQDIKVDLDLSDTQLGFLTGIAFALFYAVMGIPIARWADRGNRITLISLTTALWSAAVALCGAAVGFSQLLLIRIGVAIGEAGCQPAALSLIADQFTRAERPRAVARYMLGWPLALMVGNVAAGWLNEFYGWRMTFAMIGLPGLALVALVRFTLREPRYSNAAIAKLAPRVKEPWPVGEPNLKEVFITLWAAASYRHLLFCFSLSAFFTYGILQWQPAFFMRSHGLVTGELGTWLAAVYGLGGLFGTYVGGELASRYAPNNEHLQLTAVAIAYACFAVLKAGVYLAPGHYLAFALLVLTSVGGGAVAGPAFAATQTLVPPRMRAMSIALVLFFSNLIGMGLGPLAAGALSDALRPLFGEESLRYALMCLCPGYLWAAWHALQAGRAVRDAAVPKVETGSLSAGSAGATVAERQ